jgi:multiple sugar transport system permease protein
VTFPAPIASARVRVFHAATVYALLALWLLPMLAVALTSLRPAADIARADYWGWPSTWAFDNYAVVLGASRMARFVANSVAITLPAAAGAIALATLAGYALAKHRFAGSKALLAIFVAGNLVPFQTLMIPVRDLMLGLGLYDTRWALIVFHAAFQTGFCTLFMRNFIAELPDALIESARLDGASEWQVLRDVVLPMVRPALAAVAVLEFTFVWNDYFWALVLVQSDDVRPLTAGLQSLRGMWQTSWQLVSAASILAAIPPVALFFLMQREFVSGLAAGARPAR